MKNLPPVPEQIERKRADVSFGDVADIIGTPPNWITVYGISIVCLFVIGVIGLSFIIGYPDQIKGEGQISSAEPYTEVIARTDEIIRKLWVINDQKISKGDTIAFISDQSSIESISEVILNIKQIEIILQNGTKLPSDLPHLNLGAVGPAYNELRSSLLTNARFLATSGHDAARNGNIDQINIIENENDLLDAKKSMVEDKISISKRKLERAALLFKDSIISRTELENERVNHLSVLEQNNSLQLQYNNNTASIRNFGSVIADAESRFADSYEQNQQLVKNSLRRLQAEVKDWLDDHLFIADNTGIINLSQSVKIGARLDQGSTVYAITSEYREKNFFVEARIPVYQSGDIRRGQAVKIEVLNYPSSNYGYLFGVVSNISPLLDEAATGQFYPITILLNKGPLSSTGYKLTLQQEQPVSLSIITDAKTLAHRLWDQVMSATKSNTITK